ncbi:MAG TPA: NAD-dependent epimerase/dehydratase family protein [Pyrinomonadaceae bacterium]|jgi:CDP-glucose 4,6-dehydratase
MVAIAQNQIELKDRDWWREKKVLVTGASGFKGSWLSKALLELGAQVYGTVSRRVNPLSSYHLFNLGQGIIKVDADVSNRQQVFDMLNTIAPDVIFHLAAIAQVPIANRDPLRAFEVNVMGTINILEGCRQLGVGRRLLIVSTDHVFGNIAEQDFNEGSNFERGVIETHYIDYSGLYDTSKSAMELCVRSYNHAYWSSLPAIGITRAANVYGYGDVGTRRVLPNFINKAIQLHEIPLTCRKNGRQFIYVTDAIAGYIRAAASLNEDDPVKDDEPNYKKSLSKFPERSHEAFTPTFHFAAEQYETKQNPFIRIEELANLIGEIFQAEVVPQADCRKYAPNENAVLALNSQATGEMLGWRPRVKLAEGIGRLGRWYRHISEPVELRKMLSQDIEETLQSL